MKGATAGPSAARLGALAQTPVGTASQPYLDIERRGRDVAVLISLDDLRLLEELEDASDLAAARTALAESDERIPYEQVRAELGLD